MYLIRLTKEEIGNIYDIGFQSKNQSKPIPIDFSSYYYLDMNFSIDLVNDINFSFGINNIFDKNPPLNGKSINYVPGNANTYPSYYDPLGRFIYLNISKRIY